MKNTKNERQSRKKEKSNIQEQNKGNSKQTIEKN